MANDTDSELKTLTCKSDHYHAGGSADANIGKPHVVEIETDAGDSPDVPHVPYALVPEDHSLRSLERLFVDPINRSEKFTAESLQSLADYVVEFTKHDAVINDVAVEYSGDARIYASEGSGLIVCVFDPLPIIAGTGWGDHAARMDLKDDEVYTAWRERSGTLLTMTEFSDFIDEYSEYVVQPVLTENYPTEADMIELANSIQVSSSIQVNAKYENHSGSLTFHFDDDTTATAGRDGGLTVPKEFAIAIPIFDCLKDRFVVRAKFYYRLGNDSKPRIQFNLSKLREVRLAAFESVKDQLSNATHIPIFDGTVKSSRVLAE